MAVKMDVRAMWRTKAARNVAGMRAIPKSEQRHIPKNPLAHLDEAVEEGIWIALEQTADEIVAETKELLEFSHGNGPTDDAPWRSGDLYKSIRHGYVQSGGGNKCYVSFYADAKNPHNGDMYAKYLAQGTGDQGTHTGPTWRYMDRNGQWHTTSGMAASPFLETPVLPAVKRLEERTKAAVTHEFNATFFERQIQTLPSSRSRKKSK